eukprot:184026-Amphidinium_carterae.1
MKELQLRDWKVASVKQHSKDICSAKKFLEPLELKYCKDHTGSEGEVVLFKSLEIIQVDLFQSSSSQANDNRLDNLVRWKHTICHLESA